MNNSNPDQTSVAIPLPRQNPYELALQRGLDALQNFAWTLDRCEALGIEEVEGILRLPALGRILCVDLAQRCVRVDDEAPARAAWGVLAAHYLCAEQLAPDPRGVSFSDFPDCRSYLSVFGKRITGRFLATAGRTEPRFVQAAEALGGHKVSGAGVGYGFAVFPRVPISIVRYDGGDEFPPGASVIYRADIESLLPAEDRVVAAELLLDALAGKPMTENGGPSAQRS